MIMLNICNIYYYTALLTKEKKLTLFLKKPEVQNLVSDSHLGPFHSKISYAMANWLHEMNRRGYNECFKSIT
jgi:hypothetical protein